jgi:UDP-N-acetylmuramoyl-tripeptide--D-alanyl-D-alanine ligase
MASATRAAVVTFGETAAADVRAADVELDELARPSFVARTPWGTAPVSLAVSGRHMVGNALAALAVAGSVGVDIAGAATGLGAATVSASRMAVHRLASGAVVIDDAYNANPSSMRAALDALAALPAARRVAVIGVMAEIDDPLAAHREIAEYADRLGIDVVAVGTELYGIPPTADPLAALGTPAAGTAVLVKASRVAQLDRVAAVLLTSPD